MHMSIHLSRSTFAMRRKAVEAGLILRQHSRPKAPPVSRRIPPVSLGSRETNTQIQFTEGLGNRLIALGKPFDYMVYQNQGHDPQEGDGT